MLNSIWLLLYWSEWSSWLSMRCSLGGYTMIVPHKNRSFYLFQQDKSSVSTSKIRHIEHVFEFVKLDYNSQTREHMTYKKADFRNVWWIINSVSTKVSVLFFLYIIVVRYCLLHLIRQRFLLKSFLTTIILLTQLSLYLLYLLGLMWNWEVSLQLLRWLRMVKMVKNG